MQVEALLQDVFPRIKAVPVKLIFAYPPVESARDINVDTVIDGLVHAQGDAKTE